MNCDNQKTHAQQNAETSCTEDDSAQHQVVTTQRILRWCHAIIILTIIRCGSMIMSYLGDRTDSGSVRFLLLVMIPCAIMLACSGSTYLLTACMNSWPSTVKKSHHELIQWNKKLIVEHRKFWCRPSQKQSDRESQPDTITTWSENAEANPTTPVRSGSKKDTELTE